MTVEYKYEVIKKLFETNGNKKNAALKLKCTIRHINRMIQGYKIKDKEFFVHGNKGRRPIHAIDTDIKQNIIDLYRTKYWNANYAHF
ncbi:hypothetical protein SAMN05446037_102570 [Anaerovirgula multivorans]|uniref:Uncharacterized protein n=1 Tax=Anaerovirgula multivorans TaxID=312168 RepID=A0A239I3T6_9FIRM|nr:hypothetical protein [Anaerovirgula multivorans]SNS88546.1 hypothetical protein SAMN05446037_102570 [Anaerovirgula multivorans]